MSTPHISAQPGDFAPVCLMPGDPRRARYIAEKFLTDARLVTDVRSVEGFTGTFEGKQISIMAHGMGVPSVSIYATELVREYGVHTMIRIGSCGSLQDDLPLRSIVVSTAASTDSGVNRARFEGFDMAAVADFGLVTDAVSAAAKLDIAVAVGPIFTSDFFYAPDQRRYESAAKLGMLAVEMEAAGLYGVAAECNAKALTIATVSDHMFTGEKLSAEDRQSTFEQMVRLGLATAAAQ